MSLPPTPANVKSQIRSTVRTWYDVPWMPMTIQSREQEIDDFERRHRYIPPHVFAFVNHHARQFHRWARSEDCLDFVVWNPSSGSYRMAQDLCFRDAYPDVTAWHKAILELISDPQREVWIVVHDPEPSRSEDDHPSSPE